MPWTRLLLSLDGRITRRDYWLRGVLPLLVGLVVLAALLPVEAFVRFVPSTYAMAHPFAIITPLSYVEIAAATWISIAVGAKRYHDRNRSGWFLLIYFIPVIGPLWVWIELGFLRGTNGPNRFGRDPIAPDRRCSSEPARSTSATAGSSHEHCSRHWSGSTV
jgi:uncharacterized membrane protein YhaH (DUF805 family)